MTTPEIFDDAALARYEIRLDGKVAGFAEYRLQPPGAAGVPGASDGPGTAGASGTPGASSARTRRVVFTHTEIDPSYEGQGLGGALARGALDDVRVRGGTVVPLCPFIKGYIDRHPEYQDLVEAG